MVLLKFGFQRIKPYETFVSNVSVSAVFLSITLSNYGFCQPCRLNIFTASHCSLLKTEYHYGLVKHKQLKDYKASCRANGLILCTTALLLIHL